MFTFTKIRSVILTVSFILLAGFIGYRLGEQKVSLQVTKNNRVVLNKTTPVTSPIDFSLFWDVWDRVHTYYIESDTIDNQKLVYGAISGMVNALGDPYSSFFPPVDNKQFKQDMSGSFEGIGAELGLRENRIIVISPLNGSPAEKAGIKPGDYILKVNDEETYNWSVADAVAKIRGPKGTSVILTILHESELKPSDITIVRDTIVTPQIKNWIRPVGEIKEVSGLSNLPFASKGNDTVAYIQLSRFGDRLEAEWTQAVDQIIQTQDAKPLKGLILDLRNNPGGYLDGAVYIGSEFLKSGIVVSQQNSDGTKNDYTVDRTGRILTLPMIVLINKGSASAAEIVTGALQDAKRATIVGDTSFGKGSVQTPIELSGGSSVHITTGKWLTPKGAWISKKGIVPDITVPMDTIDATRDAQLAKALEILLK